MKNTDKRGETVSAPETPLEVMLDQVCENLRETAQRMAELSERIGTSGNPLSEFERELIRFSYAAQIRSMADEALVMFLAGQHEIAASRYRDIAALQQTLRQIGGR